MKIRKQLFKTLIVWSILLGMLCAFSFEAYAAKYNYPYPTAPNKKGLALGADMEEDALELNVCHATINFPLTEVISSKSERNSSSSYSFRYKKKKYWFRKGTLRRWDTTLKKLKKNNVIVTGILLMQKRGDLKNLLYPAARNKNAAFYAWNMDGGENQRQIEAAISFLAKRYSGGKHGRVVGWIVANEIDNPSDWNNAGGISFSAYMDLYARMFEMASRVVRSVYSNARLYIPLDHYWNMTSENEYTARACLDTFAARMAKDGYPWNLAFHAYNGDLMQPSITAEQYYPATESLDSPIITMKNLHVLTDYIRSNFGEKTRVILSEHGYSSTWKKRDVSRDQSEAIALSYYLAMADPMVDSFIYYSQVDQNELTKIGASFGLWKVSKKERATSKKMSWSIFKYMDTDLQNDILNSARSISEQMTGQKARLTRSFVSGTQQPVGKYRLKKKLNRGWAKMGAVSGMSRKSGIVLRKAGGRNQNVYWGMRKKVGKLNASSTPRLAMTVRSNDLSTGEAELLVRVFSGKSRLFEASGILAERKTRRIQVDLSGWEYRNAVTEIQILVKRRSGSWKSGARVTLSQIGFR